MAARSPRPRMQTTSSSAPKTATASSAPAAWNACRPKSHSPTRLASSRASSSEGLDQHYPRRKGKSKKTGSGENASLTHDPLKQKLAAQFREQLLRFYIRLAFPRFCFSSAPSASLYVRFVRVCCLRSRVWPDLRAGKR